MGEVVRIWGEMLSTFALDVDVVASLAHLPWLVLQNPQPTPTGQRYCFHRLVRPPSPTILFQCWAVCYEELMLRWRNNTAQRHFREKCYQQTHKKMISPIMASISEKLFNKVPIMMFQTLLARRRTHNYRAFLMGLRGFYGFDYGKSKYYGFRSWD
jgi:hypothetical protein